MLITGSTLQNRYRIISLRAQGGMGAVYRAHDQRLGIDVAVKETIPIPGLSDELVQQLRKQFQQEGTTLARLNHPNLVRVTDFFEEDGNAYLVMSFIDGESMGSRIQHAGMISEAQVLIWATQLLGALEYCHRNGVVHRDIKPANIIIQPDGQAVLVDFGLVKMWDPHDPRTRTAIHNVGTPEYAPPEQYDPRGHTDPRSDIYSLAATLYHALAGQAPPTATMRVVDPGTLRPIRALRGDISVKTDNVLLRGMELRPNDRYQSASEMLIAIQGQASPLATRPVSTTLPPTTVLEGGTASQIGTARVDQHWWRYGIIGAILIISILVIRSITTSDSPVTPTAPPLLVVITTTTESHDVTNTPPMPNKGTTITPPPVTTVAPSDTPTPTRTAVPIITDTPTPTPTPTATDTPTPPPLTGKVVFAYDRKPVGMIDKQNEIYVLDLASGAQQQLTNDAIPDWNPAWSPDGGNITWVSERNGNFDIWMMQADGVGQRPVIQLPAWDDAPAWSPDGRQIAFVSTGQTGGVGNAEIFVVNGDGTVLKRLTTNTQKEDYPTWSPSGTQLAFSSARDGGMRIYAMDTDGGHSRILTSGPLDEHPRWSPDGQWIVFVHRSERSPYGDLWLVRADGGGLIQLTSDGAAACPGWSPDSQYVIFSRARDTSGDGKFDFNDAADLFVVNVLDGSMRQMLVSAGNMRFWAPDWKR
jgi:eukaryotic-like serine/threonine-protein kinase